MDWPRVRLDAIQTIRAPGHQENRRPRHLPFQQKPTDFPSTNKGFSAKKRRRLGLHVGESHLQLLQRNFSLPLNSSPTKRPFFGKPQVTSTPKKELQEEWNPETGNARVSASSMLVALRIPLPPPPSDASKPGHLLTKTLYITKMEPGNLSCLEQDSFIQDRCISILFQNNIFNFTIFPVGVRGQAPNAEPWQSFQAFTMMGKPMLLARSMASSTVFTIAF